MEKSYGLSMKKIIKSVFERLFQLIVCLLFSIIVLFFCCLFSSKSSLSDFFTSDRISSLQNRPKEITHDVVVDISSLNTNGGIKTLTENLIKKIAEKRPNWRLILLFDCSHSDFLKLSSIKNIKIIKIGSRCNEISEFVFQVMNFITFGFMRDKLLQILLFDRIFLDSKCDLFWDPVTGGFINDFSSLPKISTIHDVAFRDANQNTAPGRVKWVEKRNLDIVKYSKKIITVSNFSKKRIMEEYGLADDFVRVISIKLAKRLKSGDIGDAKVKTTLEKYGLSRGRYLIYVSTFWENKNHGRLMESFAKFAKDSRYKGFSDVRLALVGEGGHIKKFHKICEEKGISDRVVFTGFVSDEDLRILLLGSLAMIHPSLYEGFGMPIAEAMMFGIPVACSNVSSIPEIAGSAALYFDPNNIDEMENAIGIIVSDSNLRSELVQKGYAQSEKFSDVDSMVDEYTNVFEEAMGIGKI